MTKTNYLGIHENHYRYSKENNKPGWNDSETIKNILEFILNTFEKYDLDKSIKILELGCGDGELALSLAELGYNVSGVDISPTAIEWAKEKGKTGLFFRSFFPLQGLRLCLLMKRLQKDME